MASISTATAIQGDGVVFTQTLAVSTFQGDEGLVTLVSTGGTDAAILTLTPTWTAGQTTGAYGMVDVTLTATQTASLSPGYYVVQTSLDDHSCSLSWTLLEVVAAAGQSPSYDWFVQPAEVLGLIPDIVAVANLADLPRVIGATTDAIRRYCNRHFTRRIVTRDFTPNIYGLVRLDEIPVNQVIRVATGRATALTIRGPSTAQLANVRAYYTGDFSAGLTFAGLTLSSTTSAVTTDTTLTFDPDYLTLSTLAAAIEDLGWTATVAGGYGEWPSTELIGGDAAQGALSSSGASLDVYAEEASLGRLDPELGFLQLNASSSGLEGPAWGPDWGQWTNNPKFPNRVRITYDAGFDSVPDSIVLATIEMIRSVFSRLQVDQILEQETAGDYSYTIRGRIDAVPDSVKDNLAPFRLYNA